METINYSSSEIEENNGNKSEEKKKTEFYLHENNNHLNLCKKGLINLNNLTIPLRLTELDLCHNKLVQVPDAVLNLKHLKKLDLSHNLLEYFDTSPSFCFTLEHLDLSNNNLKSPPYWVWAESPSNLTKLDLSNNKLITYSFKLNDGYFEELLQYKCLAREINIVSCGILQHMDILSTFTNVRYLKLGEFDFSYKQANRLCDVPSSGLEKCCNIERVVLSNVEVYSINASIKLFQNLTEIDLSQNKIRDLPNEFCKLKNLEVCILSHNYLLYLPDDLVKLKKLQCLMLSNNELCMLPEKLTEISCLKKLDLYDNRLYEVPEDIYRLHELDVAQNYFEEPEDEAYLYKKKNLRQVGNDRLNGRKPEPVEVISDHSPSTSDDESYMRSLQNSATHEYDAMSSSSEDWDSDNYWVPHNFERSTSSAKSSWLCFVHRKMSEGNFCPMDAHEMSVAELVKYEKMCNPPTYYESEGQFDDYSEDDS